MTREPKLTPTPCPQPPGKERASWRAAENLHHALFASEHDQLASPGEIWSVRATSPPGQEQLLLVVIAAPATQSTVAVIRLNDDPRLATEWDLIIPREVLGYPVLAQAKLAGIGRGSNPWRIATTRCCFAG